MKRKRKELRVKMRLASQTAKNLKRRRNKLMKVWQPEFCASQPKLSSIVVRQPATIPRRPGATLGEERPLVHSVLAVGILFEFVCL